MPCAGTSDTKQEHTKSPSDYREVERAIQLLQSRGYIISSIDRRTTPCIADSGLKKKAGAATHSEQSADQGSIDNNRPRRRA